MKKVPKSGDFRRPPQVLVVGSLVIMTVTLWLCNSDFSAQDRMKTYLGLPALLKELSDMSHDEGLALSVTLLNLWR